MIVHIPGLGTIDTAHIRRVTPIVTGEWMQAKGTMRGIQDEWYEVSLADVPVPIRVTTFDHAAVNGQPTGLSQSDVRASRAKLIDAWSASA